MIGGSGNLGLLNPVQHGSRDLAFRRARARAIVDGFSRYQAGAERPSEPIPLVTIYGDDPPLPVLLDGDLLAEDLLGQAGEALGSFRAAPGIAGLAFAESGMPGRPGIADLVVAIIPAHAASPLSRASSSNGRPVPAS